MPLTAVENPMEKLVTDASADSSYDYNCLTLLDVAVRSYQSFYCGYRSSSSVRLYGSLSKKISQA